MALKPATDRAAHGRRVALLFATSGHSGVDRVVANLVSELAHVDHQFDLLSIRGHGPYIDVLPSNIRPIRLGAGHRNTALFSLARYLRRERPQALLTASHRLNRCALMARSLSARSVHIALRMGMSPEGTLDSAGSAAAHRRLRSMRYWYPRGEALVTPSEGVGKALLDFGCIPAHKLHVIPNPIVNDELRTRARQPVTHPWFQPGEPPVVLGTGALIPRKDFATLIRAFARLRAHRPARLIVLGEGPQRGHLERLVAELGLGEFVELPGYVADPYPYMAAADVFALTSRAEGSGAVLVEALACGTAAVATDCPSGPAETLDNGRFGPLTPIGDDAALADALRRLLADPTPPGAREAAVAPFLASRSAARYLAALGLPGDSA